MPVVVVLLMVASACSSDEEPERRDGPRFETVACPDDVEVLVVPAHRCGYVTPDPRSARQVFVVVVEPPTPSDRNPVLETGTDLGMTPGYGGLAPIAQRTGRRTVIVDLPGTGHSTPTLECPEVRALGDLAAERHPDELTDAVTACRDRLLTSGVDPEGFTPAHLGADLFAVMAALDEPDWVVMGHGTTAEAGRQVALAHPDHVEALVMDSPVTGGQAAEAETDRVVASVAQACREDRGCRSTYGDLDRTWAQARDRLRRTPLIVDVAGTSVAIDDAALVRAVRWLVAPAALGAGRLPALLSEAAAGRPGTYLGQFAASLSVTAPLCVGYLPKCEAEQPPAIGAVLSGLCPDAATRAPWVEVCEAWGVGLTDDTTRPLRDVPALVLFGGLDPYASPEEVRDRLAALVPDAFIVENASGGHNVLAYETSLSVRNDWLAGDVRQPPPAAPGLSDPPEFTP